MFGDLFEEDEEGFSSVPSGGRFAKGKEVEPPPPRENVNLSGIKNQGGTCYLNSLLQTLLFTPEFREELFSLGPDELGNLTDKDHPDAKVRVIPLELQRLFAHLLLVKQQTASTSDLTESFGWTNNEETSQHDVQELNRILFSALESSLVGTSGSNLIHRLYHGTLVNQIVCKECSNISERQEDFLDLAMPVRGVYSLEEALWSMFVEEELFEGNNLYRCSCCNQLVQAAKSAKLRKLPPFLTMSLLRFNFDFAKCERYKETGRYIFPLTIDLRPFCEQRECPDSEFLYELFSVIIHKGGCYGGHYHVYIKDIDHLGRWEPPEEEKQKQKTQQRDVRVSEPVLEKDDPLSVLTAILAQEESKSVPVDQISQKLMDKIGTSWNKTFRKQHGPIGKFLQSNSDVFLLVAKGTRVTLKATSPPNPGSEVTEVTEVTEVHPTTEASPCESSPEVNEVQPETVVEAEGEGMAGCHWFDLNDSSVTSIGQRDIEKQFEGKESAYMLFYRKASLQRPTEALGNLAYKVPPHLIQMVEEENAKLQQRREEFDASSNSIEVRLHLAPHYRAEMGALRPVGDTKDAVITITFDRRKTVGDLRLAVYQMQDLWEGDMALTVAQSLPAGLHLYDTLADDQQSLYSAGVNSGSDLFVWNGREVSGSVVLIGAEWEPLLLTVVRPSDEEPDDTGGPPEPTNEASGSGLVRSMQGFARGATLGTLREALGPQEALVCRETNRQGAGGEGGGASGWKVFPPQDMQRTLRELALKDGDALLLLEPHELDSSIFSLSGDMVTVTTPSDCRWLQVEVRGGEREEVEKMTRRGKVPASGNMLLSEVKQKAIEELELEDKLKGVECCLRQVDRTGNLLPPVYDDITVREAGIRLMTTLFLCLGPAPKSTQLFLSFTVGSAPSAGGDMDILVDGTLTVKECLTKMLKKAGLQGDAWHLNRMDWDDEVGEVLMDENATLSGARLSHGDKLILSAGLLPPRGFMKISVWLYLDLRDISHVSMEMEVNHTTEGAESQTQEVIAAEWLGAELRIVGKVEISGEASLDDLKSQVMTLPALLDVCVPSPAFLRVWQLEGHKLGKVLRGNQQSLRKLKVTNGAEICVQRLLKEEELGPRDLLLCVQMGVPGERQYFPWEEFVWETGNESSPRALRVALSSRYGLSPDSLLLAKRLPEKHTWMPVSNWTQQVSKRKKKKKNDNLQGAPYYLKDGDIIGIKNLLIDNNRDFSTLQDDLDQQRLGEETESLKKGGQSDSAEANQESGPGRKAGQGKNRKPEVALSINVGVFR
ncbi:ubiquitin carboxyl-terminal hydrolase 40 [Clupea harengus]|uniref:Ubiquitin carboxyl-terminal hydrolase 40 n=1 Tax=Clupea harengus TaxID=7950 RepID=A0A6P3WEB1_CLUHA|nr:ubiquitin carboxyl-terminal hydrolase 40 [Clupea harengus]